MNSFNFNGLQKRVGRFLKERKLQLFFLFYVILLIPFVSTIAHNITATTLLSGIIASIVLLIVVFLLSSFMSTKMLRLFYSVLLGFAILPGCVLLGYLLFAKVLLSEGSITVLFETNPNETKEFIVSYMNPWVILGIALYILFPFLLIFKIKNISSYRVVDHKKTFISCVLLLLLFFTIEPVAQRIYFIDFYRIFADYKIRSKIEENAIAKRQAHSFHISVSKPHAPQTIVVVIGESLSRHHMSLYGYDRDTNPLLSKRSSKLKLYNDVVSPHVHTIPSIRSIITFADHANPHYFTDRPSLFELFNRAGFETFYISNQPFENVNSSYEPFLKQANHMFDLSKGSEPDGILLKTLQESLKDNKRKLIVLHLMGSHTAYQFRYPASFEYFHSEQPVAFSKGDFYNPMKQTIIDQYDNSVRYNDFLIDSIIEMLDHTKGSSTMVYFSDHGEEVYDFRDFAGHAYEKVTTYMCEIPFMVWLSDDFQKKRKDLHFNMNTPFSTNDFLYSLSDLAGLEYVGYDDTRSIFSVDFIPQDRKIGDYSYTTVQEMTELEAIRKPNENWAFLKSWKEKVSLPYK